MSSPNQMHWQDLLQLVREENPGLPLRDVMIIASKLRKSRKLPKGSYKESRSSYKQRKPLAARYKRSEELPRKTKSSYYNSYDNKLTPAKMKKIVKELMPSAKYDEFTNERIANENYLKNDKYYKALEEAIRREKNTAQYIHKNTPPVKEEDYSEFLSDAYLNEPAGAGRRRRTRHYDTESDNDTDYSDY